MKKLLFIVADGIGNQVETLPAFYALKDKYKCHIDVLNAIPRDKESTNVIFKDIAKNIYFDYKNIKSSNYFGQVLMYPYFMKKVNHIPFIGEFQKYKDSEKYSEVKLNIMASKCEYKKLYCYQAHEALNYILPQKNSPDIIIHDGYSKVSKLSKKTWLIKSYPKYDELINILKKNNFTLGSIGIKEEFLEGTIDLTNLKLENSLSYMKGCKLFISNDTGTYHLANAIKKNNIVIFTATDTEKNYNRLFHKYSTIIRRQDLICSPCQRKFGHEYWNKNKKNCKWECQNIDPNFIYEKIIEIIK